MSVTPYLTVHDSLAAIAFYRRAFGAEQLLVSRTAGGAVDHAEIALGGTLIHVRDDTPAVSRRRSPRALGGTTVGLTIFTEDTDRLFARAVEAGANVDSPPEDAPWGERWARLTDPFGHCWTIATRLGEHLQHRSNTQRGGGDERDAS